MVLANFTWTASSGEANCLFSLSRPGTPATLELGSPVEERAGVDDGTFRAVVDHSTTRALHQSSAPSSFPEYRVTRWTAENGLPQNWVKALVQTHDGYLWIGTLNGLVRFDGVKFTVFDHRNTPEMTQDAIDELVEDPLEESLWIKTREDLLRYRAHRFERMGVAQRFPKVEGGCWAGGTGRVWFQPRWGQMAMIEHGRVTVRELGDNNRRYAVVQAGEESGVVTYPFATVPNHVGAAARRDGEAAPQVILLLASGLYHFDIASGLGKALKMPAENALYLSFLQEPDGSFWLCSSTGLWRGDEKSWTRVTAPGARHGAWPKQIFRTRDGQLWVMHGDGERATLHHLVEGQLRLFTTPESPEGLEVTRLLEDRDGNLWVGTKNGLVRLQPKRIKVYSRQDGLRNDDTQAVTAGPDGTIWIGTIQGVSALRRGTVTNLPLRNLEDGACGTMATHGEDRLRIFGTPGDVIEFDGARWNPLNTGFDLNSLGGVRTLYEDREGRMWVGEKCGVLFDNQGQCLSYTTNSGLSGGDVRLIYQDRRGDMWFGTFGEGLNRLHDGKFTSFISDRGEHNNRMWWIHEDVDGIFWVATEDGLNRFVPSGAGTEESRKQKAESRNQHEGRFFTFTTEHGLGENVVNNIQEDDFGYLWLSGLRGIYRISRQQLNEVATGKRAEVECAAFGEADGMRNSECNGGDNQPAGCKDREGRIWFPTVKGVVMIDPKEIHRNEVPPPVVIEQVKANDEVIYGDGAGRGAFHRVPIIPGGDQGRGGTRPYQPSTPGTPPSALQKGSQPSTINYQLAPGGARVMEIHYTANSLVAPERTTFKYRLIGYDETWRNAGDRRVAFYTNLRAGNYRFELMARTHHGVWSAAPAPFAFTLAPHFYETWPFYGLCALGVFGLAGGVQAYRLRVQRRILQISHERSLERERARISRDLHDDLGASLTGIALQLEAARNRGRAESEQLGQLADEARALSHDLRELAWTTNPRCDNSASLAAFLGDVADRFCRAAGLHCRLDLPTQNGDLPVPARVRHELLMVLKESLTNISKHARAHKVVLGLSVNSGELRLTVTDDGRGFEINGVCAGSGLRNLRERTEQAGGSIKFESRPSAGTTVTVTIPMGRGDTN